MSSPSRLSSTSAHTKPVYILGTIVALSVATFGLIHGIAGSDIVASVLGAAGLGNYQIAVRIVDAVLAGATVAAIVGALLGGGLSLAAYAVIRWAIAKFGKKKAVA